MSEVIKKATREGYGAGLVEVGKAHENLVVFENDGLPCPDFGPFAGLHLAVAEHHARRDDLLGLGAGIHHVAGFQ